MMYSVGSQKLVWVVGSDVERVVATSEALRGVADRIMTSRSLDQVVARDGSAVVLVGSFEKRSVFEEVSAFRGRDLSSHLLLRVSRGDLSPHQIVAAQRAGLDYVHQEESAGGLDGLDQTIAKHLRHRLPSSMLEETVSFLPHSAHEAVSWMLRNSFRPLSVQIVADWHNEDRSTLLRRFSTIGLAPPSKAIIGARLAHVAWLLDSSYLPAAAVARLLGFSSGQAMTSFLLRHVGASAMSLRQVGAMEVTMRWLKQQIPLGTQRKAR